MFRRRTPTIFQMEAVECGAAALAILLAHHGKWIPLETLREMCGVSRDGSSGKGILQAARSLGMEARGFRREIDTLRRGRMPAIAFWQFNHFIVVEEVGRRRVRINDPAIGPRTISIDEFDRGYTGICLEIVPGPQFERSGTRPSLWPLLRPLLATVRPSIALFLILGLMLIVPGLVVPTFSKIFVDEVLVADNGEWLRPLILAMALAVLFEATATWWQGWCALRIRMKLSVARSARFMWHLFRLPHAFFAQRYPTDLLSRLRANDEVAQLIASDLGLTAVQFVSVLFFGAVMLLFDHVLTAIVVGLFVVSVTASLIAQRVMRDKSLALEIENAKVMSSAVSALQAIETVKATASEGFAFSQWAGYHARSIGSEQALGRLSYLLGIVPAMATALSSALVLGVGSVRIIDGSITLGTLVAFQTLTGSFVAPLSGIVNFVLGAQRVRASLSRLEDVEKHAVDPRYGSTLACPALTRARLDGRIEFDGVTFGYSRMQPPIIENLSLTVPAGARVALVGGSGSGKSTVARLMAGLYRPWSGKILLDGRPLDDIPSELLTNSIGWVDQEIVLFADTVRNNITLWDDTLSDHAVTRAAHDALIHDDIVQRPGRYDSLVLERGVNFSGGQAQRIEIARRLVRDPSILVLDEATSALDPMIEHRIDRNIRRRGCTSLVIAHRLSTIRDSDEIIVLEKGRIAERGDHDSLMSLAGRYRALIEY